MREIRRQYQSKNGKRLGPGLDVRNIFLFTGGTDTVTRRSPIRENKGGSTEELSSRSKPNSMNSLLTMLDTVLAVTGGKPDPTTKAGRGAVAAGPKPGNAIKPDHVGKTNMAAKETNCSNLRERSPTTATGPKQARTTANWGAEWTR